MPEQIQAPTQVERLSESLWGKNLQHATGQDSQTLAHALEGKTPLGMAHWRPPDPTDPQIWGSTTTEQNIVDPKARVHMHQKQGPVLDKSASAHINPWPGLGIIPADLDIYFEVSVLLEGEQNFILPSADSKQAVTPKTLECDLKPNRDMEPE